MSQETDDRIEELRAQLANRDQLKQELSNTQDALNAEAYRLDVTEVRLKMVEEEIEKLESLTLTSIVSSLMGNKPGRIDALREQCQTLEREFTEQDRSAVALQQQVEQLNEQLASLTEVEAELRTLCPADFSSPQQDGDAPSASETPSAAAGSLHSIEMAIEAGESLLTDLSGMSHLCRGLKRGSTLGSRAGALLTAGMQSYRESAASSITGGIAGSVARFCDQIAQLKLAADTPDSREILAALSQIEKFADPAGSALSTGSEAWADLEILARSLVTDLEELRRHNY